MSTTSRNPEKRERREGIVPTFIAPGLALFLVVDVYNVGAGQVVVGVAA